MWRISDMWRILDFLLYYEWNNTKGEPFHPQMLALNSIGFPLTNFVTVNESILNEFVFVTAANNAYLKPVLDGIATIQKHFPKKIIFYDIGLYPGETSQVRLDVFFIFIITVADILPKHPGNRD